MSSDDIWLDVFRKVMKQKNYHADLKKMDENTLLSSWFQL